MRRLFSSFARGWPGVGLLLMRAVAAAGLIHQGLIWREASLGNFGYLSVVAFFVAGAILLGLWTPIAGAITVLLEAWVIFVNSSDAWTAVFIGTLGAALALIGPGAWSADSRLFGWKRIDIDARKS